MSKSDKEYQRNYQRDKNRKGYRKSKKGIGFYLPSGTVVYVLDILEHGKVISEDQKWIHKPLIQAIETPGFNLFEMEYNRDKNIQLQEKITIQKGSDSKVGKVIHRLTFNKLTQTSKDLIQNTIELHVKDQEQLYVNFLNNAGPITKKRHSLNLIPGIGEKSMWDILKAREIKKFESFEDFEKRTGIKDIAVLISKRILNEIIDDQAKHYLFVKRKAMTQQSQKDSSPSKRTYPK